MYSPPYNHAEDRAEVVAFMRANSFCLFATAAAGTLRASHLPVLVREKDGALLLEAHMARANPQWRDVLDNDVLVVFTGPHAYVSPRWYATEERVPTWNYAAVHAYGRPRIVDERPFKLAAQRRLVEALDPQWLPNFDALSRRYVENMLEGIVNIEIAVSRLETRWKLSQNRGRQEQERIAAQLDLSEDSAGRALAALTRRHLAEE